MKQLDRATVLPYLCARGLLDRGLEWSVEPLAGGVSNDVFGLVGRARGSGLVGNRLVLKQSLPELKVAQYWAAPVERILTEGRALQFAAGLEPNAVPAVIDTDAEAMTLTVARAADDLANLKTSLQAGEIDPRTAVELGRVLGRWHAATMDDASIAGQFPDTFFPSLRIEPYYEHTARIHPDLAGPLLRYADQLRSEQRCLVHGDFTPKNVLACRERVWVLDWEVAHYGNPVFDLALMHTHLMLKAIADPTRSAALAHFGQVFLGSYTRQAGSLDEAGIAQLVGHIGCLLLARVDGKSPVEYLESLKQQSVRKLGRSIVLDPPPDLQGIWTRSERF